MTAVKAFVSCSDFLYISFFLSFFLHCFSTMRMASPTFSLLEHCSIKCVMVKHISRTLRIFSHCLLLDPQAFLKYIIFYFFKLKQHHGFVDIYITPV